jgi:hypothetical protein
LTAIAAQWLNSLPMLVVLAVAGGFMLTAVPVRAVRAIRHRRVRTAEADQRP